MKFQLDVMRKWLNPLIHHYALVLLLKEDKQFNRYLLQIQQKN
jgi:hypothetical protein